MEVLLLVAAFALGAVIITRIVSWLVNWVLLKTGPQLQLITRLACVHALTAAVCVALSAYGSSDGAAPNFAAAPYYVAASALWLLLDWRRHRPAS